MIFGNPCKNKPILFIFYVYFNAITSIFILSHLYYIPILPDKESRATILIVFYFILNLFCSKIEQGGVSYFYFSENNRKNNMQNRLF